MEAIFHLCRHIAEQGEPMMQYQLGIFYFNGRGVSKDKDEAIKWWHKAAEQGFELAVKVLCIGEPYHPLHTAAVSNDIETLETLIRQGTEIEVKESEGMTPLFYAAMFGNREACRMLLEAGANVHTSDNVGRSAFHQAIWNWHEEVAEMLLEAGADIHAVDGDNETPLHWAAKHGPLDALKFLLARGARTDLRDNQGNLPIDVADTEEKKNSLREAMGKT